MKKIILIVYALFIIIASKAQISMDFELKDAVSNKLVDMNKIDTKGLVIVFLSNKCPFSIGYNERLNQMEKQFSDDITFIYVNSFTGEDESTSSMKAYAKQNGLKIYLEDKGSKLKNLLQVKKSPHAVILKPTTSGYNFYYTGPIDSNPQVANDVKSQYLKDNINNLLNGKPISKISTPIMGCMIK